MSDVKVYDSVFPASWRNSAYTFVRNSLYSIGWSDTNEIDTQNVAYLHSNYDQNDIKTLGFFEAIQCDELKRKIEGLAIKKCVVNLSTPTETHFAHTHEGVTLLYYVNLRWREEWAGETIFYNDDISEVEFTSMYKPGRVVLFDGSIPHTFRPQSGSAPDYRFTISIQFEP